MTRLVRGHVERTVSALPCSRRRIADDHRAVLRHAGRLVAVEREVARDGNFVRGDVDGLASDRGAVLECGEHAERGVRARLVPVLLTGDGHRADPRVDRPCASRRWSRSRRSEWPGGGDTDP